MKSTIVPAQITSVEDRVAASLTLKQLLIFISAIALEFSLFVLIPDNFKFNIYKSIIMTVIGIIVASQGIRYKERLIYNWLILIAKYSLRPKLYLYDRNTSHLRFAKYKKPKNNAKPSNIRVPDKKIPLSDSVFSTDTVWQKGKGFRLYANQAKK